MTDQLSVAAVVLCVQPVDKLNSQENLLLLNTVNSSHMVVSPGAALH